VITLRPSLASDFSAIQLGHFDRLAVGGNLAAAGNAWEGRAVSAVEDGRVLGIAGLLINGDEGTVTMALSDELRARPCALHRLVKRKLRETMDKNSLRHLHAMVHREFDAAQRWLERLGFRYSGAENEDWWRYTYERS
jgi:L-amino acid N-acyltransferase YncA